MKNLLPPFLEWRKPAKQKPIIKRCNPSRFELDSSWPLVIFMGIRSRIPPLHQSLEVFHFMTPPPLFLFHCGDSNGARGEGGGICCFWPSKKRNTFVAMWAGETACCFSIDGKIRRFPFIPFPLTFLSICPHICGQLSEWATNQQGIS